MMTTLVAGTAVEAGRAGEAGEPGWAGKAGDEMGRVAMPEHPGKGSQAAQHQARWQSVVARDRTADGQFVYAVRSTGIYCRPSCASRKPTRSRVEFFATPAEAEAGGYRACARCRPGEPVPADPWVDRIRRACAYLARVDGHPSLTTLARRVGGSPSHLQRSFKRLVGVTPREFAEAVRVDRVKQGLRDGLDVTTALVDAGYASSSRFYEGEAPRLGMPPASYKRRGAGITIRYAITGSPLGRLLVAATDRGVCTVAMGASDAELRRNLEREYPASEIAVDRRGLGKWTTEVVAHLSGRLPRLDLPLDIRATAFQRQVWNALAAIPRGETRSYAEIAAAIGRPKAARAVARACASNPVALAVPCHRVVPAAGGVGGYRWGAGRKEALLALERRRPE